MQLFDVNFKIPQDPNNLGFDIFGNTLTNPGTPQRNAKVYGWTGAFDGTAYLAIASIVGTETVTLSTGTSALTVSAGRIDFTAGWCGTFTLSNGHTYIVESDITSAQVQVWSNNGGPVGVLAGPPTLPFFTTQKEGSLLLASGFRIEGENYIPAGATTDPLTQKARTPTVDTPAVAEMLPNVELSEADATDESLTTAATGVPKQLTFAELLVLRGESSWGGSDGNKFEVVIYNPTPDVEANTRIDTYYSRRYPI